MAAHWQVEGGMHTGHVIQTIQNRSSQTSISHTSGDNYVAAGYSVSLTAVQTAAIKSGRYVYDLQINAADGTVTRVLEGVITFRPEVTK